MTKWLAVIGTAWAFAAMAIAGCSSDDSTVQMPVEAGAESDSSTADSAADASGRANADAALQAQGEGGASVGASDASAGNVSAGEAGATIDAATETESGTSTVADGGNAALQTACTSACAAQTKLTCPTSDCVNSCVGGSSMTANPSVSCSSSYAAMANCEAALPASAWICSTDGAPIPLPGKCTTTLCAWACCVGSLLADSDVWNECMPSCK